jgi:methionyl-tRNA formyltransferase
MQNLRIIFMGTAAFARPSLEALLDNGYQVVAVVTAPDKPQGRGKKIMASPIKEMAALYHLPILQPTNLKDPQFLENLANYHADLQVVVAFRMLPAVVWLMPRLGTINLHASLLPAYRGAAPINWAIINGEVQTGLTTFFIEETLDTGQIVFQVQEPIYPQDDFDTLALRLQHKGAKLLLKTVRAIQTGTVAAQHQPDFSPELEKKAPKIFKTDCQINWHSTTKKIVDFIRGLASYPSAWTILQGRHIKLLKASPVPRTGLEPGVLDSDNKHYLYIGTQDGAISVELLQAAGKTKMDIQAFLRGNQFQA